MPRKAHRDDHVCSRTETAAMTDTDTTGLVERLRDINACEFGCDGRCDMCPNTVAEEAVAALTAQSVRIKELEAERTSLLVGIAARDDDIRRKDEALRACLSYEEAKAHLIGLSDCTCVFHSREADREYEAGRCPHQLARAALAPAKEASDG